MQGRGPDGTDIYPTLSPFSAILGVSNVNVVAGAVPEPATWGMMILGFGAVGASLRSRSKKAVATFA